MAIKKEETGFIRDRITDMLVAVQSFEEGPMDNFYSCELISDLYEGMRHIEVHIDPISKELDWDEHFQATS